MSTDTVPEKKNNVSVQPFGVHIDHPQNCDVLVQSIPGCRLRSSIGNKGGMMSPGMAQTLGMLPFIPGMQLHINPSACAYTIIDPLYEDEELCEKIRVRLMQSRTHNFGDRLRGIAPQKGTLDKDRMKSLCREVLTMIRNGDVKVIKGVEPDLEDINDLPGDFLLNPGAVVQNTQPRYEKDWENWISQMSRAAG